MSIFFVLLIYRVIQLQPQIYLQVSWKTSIFWTDITIESITRTKYGMIRQVRLLPCCWLCNYYRAIMSFSYFLTFLASDVQVTVKRILCRWVHWARWGWHVNTCSIWATGMQSSVAYKRTFLITSVHFMITDTSYNMILIVRFSYLFVIPYSGLYSV